MQRRAGGRDDPGAYHARIVEALPRPSLTTQGATPASDGLAAEASRREAEEDAAGSVGSARRDVDRSRGVANG